VLQVANVGLDCRDVWRVVNFWAAALDRPVDDDSSDHFASIGANDHQRTQPAWFFHLVPEPPTSKNRVHVDLIDLDIGVHSWTVMEDPEGHVFCVAAQVYQG
jgi:hypothetical protein